MKAIRLWGKFSEVPGAKKIESEILRFDWAAQLKTTGPAQSSDPGSAAARLGADESPLAASAAPRPAVAAQVDGVLPRGHARAPGTSVSRSGRSYSPFCPVMLTGGNRPRRGRHHGVEGDATRFFAAAAASSPPRWAGIVVAWPRWVARVAMGSVAAESIFMEADRPVGVAVTGCAWHSQ